MNDRWERWSCLQPSSIIDTTLSAPVFQPFESSWEYYDVNKKRYFLKYEAVCSIGNPRLIWFSGPYKSTVQDCTLSHRSQLRLELLPNERLLADKGYLHDTDLFICPVSKSSFVMDLDDRARNYMIYSARQTIERIFGRLKSFGFWNTPWKASIGLHKLCAKVTAKLVNLHLLFEPV